MDFLFRAFAWTAHLTVLQMMSTRTLLLHGGINDSLVIWSVPVMEKIFNAKEIVDTLFKNIPYSKETGIAQEKIASAIDEAYVKELRNVNELEAAGIILQKYSHLSEAGKLAGYTERQISQWQSRDSMTDKKYLKCLFRKERWLSYFTGLSAVLIAVHIFNLFTEPNWISLAMLAVWGGIFFVVYTFFRKMHKTYSFDTIRLDSEAHGYLQNCSDLYRKKLINSIFIFVGYLFYLIITIVYSIFSLNAKGSEAFEVIILHMTGIEMTVYLVFKNFLCGYNCEQFMLNTNTRPFRRHLRLLLIGAGAYWGIASLLLLLILHFNGHLFHCFFFFVCFYVVGIFLYNVLLRKKIVFLNIRRNIKKAVVYILALILFITYQAMGADNYLIQPYISRTTQVGHTPSEITYQEDSGVYTITTKKETFRILQLTDIHLGGSAMSVKKDLKALQTVYDLIVYAHPDFVVVTGDLTFPLGIMSFSRNNATPVVQFADFMRNIDIPWAFTYGNHDTESMAVASADSLNDIMQSLSFKSSGNFLYPYTQPDIWGRNNQIIEVRNTDGTLMQALFLIDSNAYVEGVGINDYDYIHDDQVDWYEKQILKLNEREGRTIPSMAFFHIPLQEYKEAYDLYTQGSSSVQYYYGVLGENRNHSISCSDYPSKFFDKAVELGSTKAMFCGHDHYNNLSVAYKGIRLTYGYSIDYLAMPGIEKDIDQRGATIIDIHKTGTYEITPVLYKNIK